MFKGWETLEKPAEVHTVPADDIHEHSLDFNKCKCHPIIDGVYNDATLICHNSFDNREQYENLQ